MVLAISRMERSYSGGGCVSATSSDEEEDQSSLCDSIGSFSSDDQDLMDEATSSSDSSPSSSLSPSSPPLIYEMSDLMAVLPIKRGLSKHYQGKSQSFTSLASVRLLEDLPKQERPMKKKLKTCKSYGGGLEEEPNDEASNSMGCISKIITKKPSKGKRLGFRPLLVPHRSQSFSCQSLLFA